MSTTPLPTAPNSVTRQPTFAADIDTFFAALPTFQTEMDALGGTTGAAATAASASETSAEAASATALASANFKGAWSALVGAAAVPYSVSHLGRYWMLLSNIADVTAKTPGTDAEWQEILPAATDNFDALWMASF